MAARLEKVSRRRFEKSEERGFETRGYFAFGTKAILQIGQAPGAAETTLGCIGQEYFAPLTVAAEGAAVVMGIFIPVIPPPAFIMGMFMPVIPPPAFIMHMGLMGMFMPDIEAPPARDRPAKVCPPQAERVARTPLPPQPQPPAFANEQNPKRPQKPAANETTKSFLRRFNKLIAVILFEFENRPERDESRRVRASRKRSMAIRSRVQGTHPRFGERYASAGAPFAVRRRSDGRRFRPDRRRSGGARRSVDREAPGCDRRSVESTRGRLSFERRRDRHPKKNQAEPRDFAEKRTREFHKKSPNDRAEIRRRFRTWKSVEDGDFPRSRGSAHPLADARIRSRTFNARRV